MSKLESQVERGLLVIVPGCHWLDEALVRVCGMHDCLSATLIPRPWFSWTPVTLNPSSSSGIVLVILGKPR